jgi:histone H3/H4
MTESIDPIDDLKEPLERVLARLTEDLQRPDGPSEFSDRSLSTLLERQTHYLEALGLEAIRVARRAHADTVSAADVENAARAIQGGPRGRLSRVLDPLGGLLAGAGLSQLYAVLSAASDSPSTLAYVLAAVSTVAGIAMLAFSIGRDWE